MAVYRTADGDKMTVETHSRGIVISSDLRLTTHPDPPGAAAARGDLVTQSPVSAFEDIFHDDLQFDIDVEPTSGGKKEFTGCMAVGGSPQSLEWECASINS